MRTRIQSVPPPYDGKKIWVLQYSIIKDVWINHFWGSAGDCIHKRKTIRKDLKKGYGHR